MFGYLSPLLPLLLLPTQIQKFKKMLNSKNNETCYYEPWWDFPGKAVQQHLQILPNFRSRSFSCCSKNVGEGQIKFKILPYWGVDLTAASTR